MGLRANLIDELDELDEDTFGDSLDLQSGLQVLYTLSNALKSDTINRIIRSENIETH